jgi:hypothetical protein
MKLKRLFLTALVFCIAFALAGAAAWGAAVKEGDWEVTMVNTMQGMPFQMPPQTYKKTQCVTQEDMAPVDRSKKDCIVKDQRMDGNTFYWKVICEDKSGRSESEGQITYSGNIYNGTINTTITDTRQGGAMAMLTKLDGRYIGPCSAATKAEAEKRKAMLKK